MTESMYNGVWVFIGAWLPTSGHSQKQNNPFFPSNYYLWLLSEVWGLRIPFTLHDELFFSWNFTVLTLYRYASKQSYSEFVCATVISYPEDISYFSSITLGSYLLFSSSSMIFSEPCHGTSVRWVLSMPGHSQLFILSTLSNN